MAKMDKGKLTGDPVTYQRADPAGGVQMETFIPWTLIKRGVRRQVVTPLDAPEEFRVEAQMARREVDAAQHTPLIRALGLAHYWERLIDDGKFRTLTEIAAGEGMDVTHVRRILRLTLLTPAMVERLVADAGATSINLEFVLRRAVPADWRKQEALFAGTN